MKKLSLSLLAVICLLPACKEETPAGSNQAENAPVQQTPTTGIDTSAWLGKWDGPEGTFLNISEREIGYKITIQNLDGPQDFDGVENDGVIEFKRDGRTEIIRAGDGAATGMKWLADKKNCLVVTYGEGYCRG